VLGVYVRSLADNGSRFRSDQSSEHFREGFRYLGEVDTLEAVAVWKKRRIASRKHIAQHVHVVLGADSVQQFVRSSSAYNQECVDDRLL
jgi:hypothetical protein